jgi:DNA-binding protein HU-beta
MNKTELINQIAESAGISKKSAGDALQGFMDAITDTLKKGDKLQLIGFGTFTATKRAARTCRNPQTGKEMKVPAKNVVKFKVGKKLSELVNS